jgi:hypothetical protein
MTAAVLKILVFDTQVSALLWVLKHLKSKVSGESFRHYQREEAVRRKLAKRFNSAEIARCCERRELVASMVFSLDPIGDVARS